MYQDQPIASGSPMEHAIALCFGTSLPTLREQASHAVNRHLARHSSCNLRDSPPQHSLSAEGYLYFCRLLSWFRWSRGKHQPSDRLSVWAPLLHRCNGTAGLHVPVLLVLAYLAIGYVFWVLAQLGSWAQTRARELDYLRLADAPPESCRDVPMGALDLSLTNPDLPTYAIDQFLGVVADPGLEHCLDVLDLFNAL